MTEYLQECFLSGDVASSVASTRARVEAAAAEVTAAGARVRLVRAIFVPVEETLFLLWQADTEEAVRRAGDRAGLGGSRITRAM